MKLSAAHRLVHGNLLDKQVVALSSHDYWSVLEECRAGAIAGGTVYDALIVRVADEVVTLKDARLKRLAPPGLRLRIP